MFQKSPSFKSGSNGIGPLADVATISSHMVSCEDGWVWDVPGLQEKVEEEKVW
jgi:hypothetical protein